MGEQQILCVARDDKFVERTRAVHGTFSEGLRTVLCAV